MKAFSWIVALVMIIGASAANAAVTCELESIKEVYGAGSLPNQFTLTAKTNGKTSPDGTYYWVGPDIFGNRVGYAHNPKIASAHYRCTGEL